MAFFCNFSFVYGMLSTVFFRSKSMFFFVFFYLYLMAFDCTKFSFPLLRKILL